MAMDFLGSLRQRDTDQLDGDSGADQIILEAVTELMRRGWWTRSWVVQEVLMSRRVFIQCGDRHVDIVDFVHLVNEEGNRGPFPMEDEFGRANPPF